MIRKIFIKGVCNYCDKIIWSWQRKDYLEEGYGDGKALCHVKCFELDKKTDFKIEDDSLGEKEE